MGGFEEKKIHDWHLKFEKKSSPAPVEKTREAKSLSMDIVLLSCWILICAVAVARLGSVTLIIPTTLVITLLLNYRAGVFNERLKKSSRRNLFDKLSFVNNLSLVLFSAYYMDQGDAMLIVSLFGTAFYVSDLFVVVYGKLFESFGYLRIFFTAFMLIIVTFSLFNENYGMSYIAFYIVLDRLTSNIEIIRDILFYEDYNMKSSMYKIASISSISTSVLLRFLPHLVLTKSFLDTEGLDQPFGIFACILLGLGFDLYKFVTLLHVYDKDVKNSYSPEELIKQNPEIYQKSNQELVSDLIKTA